MNPVDAERRPDALAAAMPLRTAAARRFADALVAGRTAQVEREADDAPERDDCRGVGRSAVDRPRSHAAEAAPDDDARRSVAHAAPEGQASLVDAVMAHIADALHAARALPGDRWRIRLRLAADIAPHTELDLANGAGRFSALLRTACPRTCAALSDALPALDAALRDRHLHGAATAIHLVDPDELS